jgi:hypothetical protein
MPPQRCLFCQHDNSAAARFCDECGTPLNLRPCTSCNAVDSRQATACYRCGAPFAPMPARAPAPAEPGQVQAEMAASAPGNAASTPTPREPTLAMSWQPPEDPSDLAAVGPRPPDVPSLVIPPRVPPTDLGDGGEGPVGGVRWGRAGAFAAMAVIAALALVVDREGRRRVTATGNATRTETGGGAGWVVVPPSALSPADAPAPAATGTERPESAAR